MNNKPGHIELRRFCELMALCGLAVAQPLFDLLAKNASLFIAWQASTADLILVTLLIVVGPPAALWLLGVCVGVVGQRTRSVAHTVSLAVVAALIAIAAIKKTSVSPGGVITLGIAVGAIAGFAVFRWQRIVSQWLRFLALAPPLFGLLFLFGSAVTPLVGGSDGTTTRQHIGSPARVVMIVMDEFPLVSLLDGNGHIDAQLYPNFAALAGDGTWYRNDTTVAPHTEEAVPAILSGTYPKNPRTLPHVSAYPNNLFTMLAGRYTMNVHEEVTSLCPASQCHRSASRTGVRSGFVGMVRDIASIWRDFATPSTNNSFRFTGIGVADPQALDTGQRFLDTLHPTNTPRLDFLHLLMPHFPWHYAPSGQRYDALPLHTLGLTRNGQVWANDWAGVMGRQRHLLQVAAADRFLGQVISRLKAIGAYENSLVVVTADHGVAFHGGLPFRGVAQATYPDIMWTPLIMKAPGQQHGGIDDRRARSIDVLPTIADMLHVQTHWKFDGISLLGPAQPDGPRRLLDWERSAIHPPSGQEYLTFDGPSGFRKVVASQAALPSPQDLLRQFRVGPFAAIVGRSAATMARGNATPSHTATLDQALWYPKVDVFAQKIPWTDVHGFIDAPVGTNMAIALNGTVAGVYQPVLGASHGRSEFWGVLPSTLFKLGPNDVTIYIVTGTAEAPILTAVNRINP